MKSFWSRLSVHFHPVASRGRRSRVVRAAQRGVTLIEILIVLAIIGLIAGGIAMTAIPKFKQAQIQTTHQSAQQLRQAAEMWRTTNASECPTVERLKQEKQLEATSKLTDAWDSQFKIICDDDDTTVMSPGPDKKEGTPDDIRVPDVTPQK
ncbi:MAG TPA: prepilin-type N-terminal cleavage/methylation domain-containing protein [Polyangiaceae bacterium]|nr:prepilin-type N-terminal cleavage/methylation domain-containing protein [Polyangiaceae bacterium]